MNINETFFLNGYELYINERLTLNDILQYFNYKNQLFILEYNNLICNPTKFSKININSNDKIEIISIAGGG